jgi:hypothetical protein
MVNNLIPAAWISAWILQITPNQSAQALPSWQVAEEQPPSLFKDLQ